MDYTADDILATLDQACESFTFPMLDNGYVYPAAARLSLHRSDVDWAFAFEVFGFSPRAGIPDISLYTIASRLHNRRGPEQFATVDAHQQYLDQFPNTEMSSIYPIDDESWIDEETGEFVAEGAATISIRGTAVPVPSEDA